MRKFIFGFFSCVLLSGIALQADEGVLNEHVVFSFPQGQASHWHHLDLGECCTEDGECEECDPDEEECCDGMPIVSLEAWFHESGDEWILSTASLRGVAGVPESAEELYAYLSKFVEEPQVLERSDNDMLIQIFEDEAFVLMRAIWTERGLHVLQYTNELGFTLSPGDVSLWTTALKGAKVQPLH